MAQDQKNHDGKNHSLQSAHSDEAPEEHIKHCKLIKPENKILKILILGGGPIGLFAGYKLLKKGNDITIFEKRKKYTRHNILSLKETTKLDTLSLIPSEIMEELNNKSSFSNLNADISETNKKCYKNILKDKPYLMVSSRIYYIVLNELENAYEKHFKLCGGNLIRPEIAESYTNIKIENNKLLYSENENNYSIDMSEYDIVFINDGANSFYRNIYFENTSYTENIEPNVIRYGLTKQNQITVANNIKDIEPLAYGLILIYNIENKEEFQDKFKTEDKLKNRVDFESVLELENKDDNILKGLSVKEILIQNSNNKENTNKQLNSQNLFRMFVSENYLYISIMVNPKDVGDFAKKIQNQNLLFDDIPKNLQIYLMFALYYYDLSELIDPRSKNLNLRMFPLNFGCVKQSCTFIKKEKLTRPTLQRQESFLENIRKKDHLDENEIENIVNNKKLAKNYYQFIMLCGDAMASGNFHAGIVLNRNLVAVNDICRHIDEYIDSYPKDDQGNLNNNFLRLLFFHGNLLNQKARNEIITKSIDALINFNALDNDTSVFNLSQILTELNEIILCKNCVNKNKLMCKNSAAFVKYIVENSSNEVLQRILKYLFLPDKYKYIEILENISDIEASESTFE